MPSHVRVICPKCSKPTRIPLTKILSTRLLNGHRAKVCCTQCDRAIYIGLGAYFSDIE